MLSFSFLRRVILVGSFLLLSSSYSSFAQGRIHRRFKTQQVLLSSQKQFPEYKAGIDSSEKHISQNQRINENRPLKIPVVFHVMTTEGQKFPDKGQIQQQLDILNVSFGTYIKKNTNKGHASVITQKYDEIGADLNISFYIPEKVGEVPGINVVKTAVSVWDLDNQIQNSARGGVSPVDPGHVINIWIGELGKFNAGYSHLPGAPEKIDGIVIDPDYFGTEKGTAKAPYIGGRTLVHLMGSYLGLYELWNDKEPCEDDLVADTPIHNAPTESVSSEKNARYITLCNGLVHVMYMNFMDNTDDEFLTLFTPGQKERIRAVLLSDGARNGLVKK